MSTRPTNFRDLPDDLSPHEFSTIVRSTTDGELADVMRTEDLRARVLRGIFDRMPDRLRADKTVGISATVHWKLGGSATVWEVRIDNGTCTTTDQPQRERPTVRFELDDITFLRLIAGQVSGMRLMMTGKLKVRGDVLFARRVEAFFNTEQDE